MKKPSKNLVRLLALAARLDGALRQFSATQRRDPAGRFRTGTAISPLALRRAWSLAGRKPQPRSRPSFGPLPQPGSPVADPRSAQPEGAPQPAPRRPSPTTAPSFRGKPTGRTAQSLLADLDALRRARR